MRGAALLVLAGAAACATEGVRPTQNTSAADSADQVMLGMATNMLDDGVRTGYVVADTTFVYQAAQRMDLRRLRVTFFEHGRPSSVITADQGDYSINTGSLDARGRVRVQASDGRLLTTPHLIYDRTNYQLRSDTTFVFTSPGERLTGTRFVSDLEFRNVVVDGPKGLQRRGGIFLSGEKP